jgi:hypothetical protein
MKTIIITCLEVKEERELLRKIAEKNRRADGGVGNVVPRPRDPFEDPDKAF